MFVSNPEDPGSIPRSGRSSGEGSGKPLQYPCLENPMDGGAWQATVRGVAKGWRRLSHFPTTTNAVTVVARVISSVASISTLVIVMVTTAVGSVVAVVVVVIGVFVAVASDVIVVVTGSWDRNSCSSANC